MGQRLHQVKLNNIQITDKLFGQYVKKVSEKIIPHQWNILNDRIEDTEPSYCIRNFRIAAGELEGKRLGVVFLDTDLYKWLEAVAFSIAGGYGKEYENLADKTINLIGRAQEADGYLNTYFTVNAPERKWTNLAEGHELYTAGHMIEAAVAYYNATGKTAFLDIARKNADLICRVFGRGEDQKKGYPGHQEIELALVKLYRVTGQKSYLETAKYFIEERGQEPNYLNQEIKVRGGMEFFPDQLANLDMEYFQAHKPVKEQETAEGHAVRVAYMLSAMADLAEECNDKEMLEACKRIWNNAVNRRMYITGGIGTSGFRERFTTDYDLPNNTNYSETCASVGLMMTGQRLASATGNAGYYDIVERALYNTVLAGINIEGDRYFYVNPLEMVPKLCTSHTYMDHVKAVRQKWFGVACCPPNVARTLASLGQYIYAQDTEALYIHLFISSSMSTSINGNEIKVSMESLLLQNGTVSLNVNTQQPNVIKIRMPEYASETECLVNGECVDYEQSSDRYLKLCLVAGTYEITLDFHVKPQWVAANDEVRADAGKAALVKGPLVYCLEEADNGDLLSQVYVEANAAVEMEAPVDALIGDVPTLVYPGIRLSNKVIGEHLYGELKPELKNVTLKAIPYCLWNNRGQGEMLVWHKVKV